MHISDDYTKNSDTNYNSIPEILGDYTDSQGNTTNTEVKIRNGFLEFYVYNVYVNAYGDVEFVKKGDDGQSLQGAKFALYENCENGIVSNPVTINGVEETAISDVNGNVSFEDIPVGTYYMQEIEAPSGYQIDDTVYKVIIEDKSKTGQDDPKSKITDLDGNEVEEIVNNKISYGTVSFEKVNAEHAKVAGAVKLRISEGVITIVDKPDEVEWTDNNCDA